MTIERFFLLDINFSKIEIETTKRKRESPHTILSSSLVVKFRLNWKSKIVTRVENRGVTRLRGTSPNFCGPV